ncbi:SpoIIE family protein phosphatase [Streptomyces sp. NBC_01341]|uniref:SpoIIE family protein phosphatase n=1 Tax=Streptomyces sp. NBC_01341 TaxID=2903831 RepID=UPI002E0FB88F|nr:SpoIIE family protein phosphatase [Streptomyces sp. NBC_01341]
MTAPEIDYKALFAAHPSPSLVLGPDLVIVAANRAYCRVIGRPWKDLVGQYFFDALPGNPADPEGVGAQKRTAASIQRVLTSGQSDVITLQKYDIPVVQASDRFEERWWSVFHIPVPGPDGKVVLIIHRVEDMTEFVQPRHADHDRSGRSGRVQDMRAELYARAQESRRLTEELQEAHARERRVAVALQEAMLQSPDLAQHQDVAVRYLPAVASLDICGDWFDVVDLPGNRFTVAVGDVVGHDLAAAAVMGMLRSALGAASRSNSGPAQALEVLGNYAHSVEGASAATAVQVLIDIGMHMLVYSTAGHPPPILLHADGSSELLDHAADPPLGVWAENVPRSQVAHMYKRGDALVLYTDGLIERRGEDIDVGLARLRAVLAACAGLDAEHLADVALDRLGVSGSSGDDITLVVATL